MFCHCAWALFLHSSGNLYHVRRNSLISTHSRSWNFNLFRFKIIRKAHKKACIYTHSIHLADFERFDAFVAGYQAAAPLSGNELEDLPNWIRLVGVIKFAKEIRVMLQRPTEVLRRKRALAISGFLRERISV